MQEYAFRHRHLLGIEGMTPEDINNVLDLADGYVELNRQAEKKNARLRGRTWINCFFENSTRTRTSFEVAGKRLGADVIKIEPKAGDDMRHSQLSKEWAEKGLGPSFLGINANKRSLTLDLQQPQGVAIVKRLAERADIVWENFRPGVMERFGLGYEMLRAINPRLIYCAVSGFGQNGPERNTAAFDGKLQAMSGIMSITGHEDNGPTRAGFALCDTIGAMTAAFAVSSALFQRSQTGAGPASVWLDVAREYTERWVHQQHIRDAAGVPGQVEAHYVGPVIATFMHALPAALAEARRPAGTAVSPTSAARSCAR